MSPQQIPITYLARVIRGLAVAACVAVTAGCGASSDSDSLRELPDVEVTDVDGSPVSTSEFVGEPLVMNFWYSTCTPCAKELADFAAVDAELGDDVRFIGINPLDDPDSMVEFAAERGVTYDLFNDPVAELQAQLKLTSFPATVLVDADGQVTRVSGVLDADELREQIDELLSESSEST